MSREKGWGEMEGKVDTGEHNTRQSFSGPGVATRDSRYMRLGGSGV